MTGILMRCAERCETDSPPMPMQAARRLKRASTEQDEHVVAPGFLSRVLALVRRQQVRA